MAFQCPDVPRTWSVLVRGGLSGSQQYPTLLGYRSFGRAPFSSRNDGGMRGHFEDHATLG